LQDFPAEWRVNSETDTSENLRSFLLVLQKSESKEELRLAVKQDSLSREYKIVEMAKEKEKLYFKLSDEKNRESIISCQFDPKDKFKAVWSKSDASFPLPKNTISLTAAANLQAQELVQKSDFKNGIILNEWVAFRGVVGDDKDFYAMMCGDERKKDFNKGRYYYTRYWQDIVLNTKAGNNFTEWLPQTSQEAGSLSFGDNFETAKWYSADGSKELPVAINEINLPYKLHEVSKKILEQETTIPFVVLRDENSVELSAAINQYIHDQFENVYAAYGLDVVLSCEVIYFSNLSLIFEIRSSDKKTLFQTVNLNIRTGKSITLGDYFDAPDRDAQLRKHIEAEIKRLGYKAESTVANYAFTPQNIRFSVRDNGTWRPVYIPYKFLKNIMKGQPDM
jgi:hypothetical protein